MADLVSLLNVLRRKSEQRCGKDFKAQIMPLRCVNACGHPSTLPELAGGMSEWQYRKALRTRRSLSTRRERSCEELSRCVKRMAILEDC